MIGVVAPEGIRPVVEEFFQLFKTPWRFAGAAESFDVLLCAGTENPGCRARAILIYGSQVSVSDASPGPRVTSSTNGGAFAYGNSVVPLYGRCVTFAGPAHQNLVETSGGHALAILCPCDSDVLVRIGFDLFDEVRRLLTDGQPAEQAHIPALDLHIALLRDLILGFGIPLVEIPPVPNDYSLMVCLTHDVDHPVFRNHLADRTMVGFLARATLGSGLDFVRGRAGSATVCRNWWAALRSPFVFLGLLSDPWRQSLLAYAEIEKGLGSTFFFIPFGGEPGTSPSGGRSPARAAKYDLTDLRSEIERLASAGCEIGLHGIDAWRDEVAGRTERAEIAAVTRAPDMGVRMHWLYFAGQTPEVLDRAGFSYDSTFGYNQTIGFRAGTAQMFRPFGTTRLLELPLHVMDTALFYPSHLHLTPDLARGRVTQVVDQVMQFGGVLTVNWHDRSTAPERCWDSFYRWFLQELKSRSAWFPTAASVAAWFRHRRSVSFESVQWTNGGVRIRSSVGALDHEIPGLRLRVHRPSDRARAGHSFVDATFVPDISLPA